MSDRLLNTKSNGYARVSTDEQSTLTHLATDFRMAAIFRSDLPLPPGKLAAQAGHAFLAAWCLADESLAQAYAEAGLTKIVLVAPNLAALVRIREAAAQRGVSHALITDAARTVLPEPTVTVLGLGPMTRTDFNALTRGLELL